MPIRFISAGAGSGKTYRLTELLSERLANGQARPEAVMATTFTRKAAAELVERVRQRLIADGHYLFANSMGQALIGTVNSVCGQLLSRYAFEAGLSPHLEVLGEREQPLLFAQALDEAMTSADIRRMNALAGRLGIEDWRADVQRMAAAARANDIPAEQLAEHARRSTEDLLAFFPQASDGDFDSVLRVALARSIADIDASGNDTKVTRAYLDLLRGVLHRMDQGGAPWGDWVRLTNKQPAKPCVPMAEPVQRAAKVYERHPGLHRDLRDLIEGVFELAGRALHTYQGLKAERGLMDFVDQEQEALRLLDRPEVADSLAKELDLLLVDEFQDTSPVQLALFLKLAALAGECIWVGDIKQAIYGFRGTDPELMKAVVDAMESSGGQVETLGFSWRARPALVDLANALFVPAFDGYLSEDQVRLSAKREEVLDDPALQLWELQGRNQDQRAAALAAGVSHLLESGAQILDKGARRARPICPGDIAILNRTNDNAARVAGALSAMGLAVSLEQAGLLATPEVHLTLACLRRLVDPADTLASAEIVALKNARAPEEWLQNRLDYLDAGSPSHQWGVVGAWREPALVALEALRQRLPFLSPSEVLDEVLAAADVYRDAKAWGPSEARAAQRLGNLETLRGLAAEYEEQCGARRVGATVAGFLLWLYDLAENVLDKRGVDSQGDAVQVLTHHGAKGLEWPVVISADMEASIKPGLWGLSVLPAENGFDIHAPLADRRLRYWPWPFQGLSSNIPLADRLAGSPLGSADLEQQTREAVRLLYVSFTRARDCLILPLQAKAKARPWLETLGADWLTVSDGALSLPSGGLIPCSAEVLVVPEEEPRIVPVPQQTWFPAPAVISPKLQAYVSPSTLPPESRASVGQIIELGPRLTLRGRPDPEILGDALHNILAAELIDPDNPDRREMAAGVLQRHGLVSALDVDEVLACASRFREKVTELFQPTRAFAEWPVNDVLDNGQTLRGWIDVLLETADGWILIDHKSFPGARGEWPDKALTYSGQLEAYRKAVERATNQPGLGRWIHFSVGGGLVEVRPPAAG